MKRAQLVEPTRIEHLPVAYIRETDGAKMVEVSPGCYIASKTKLVRMKLKNLKEHLIVEMIPERKRRSK